MQPSPLTTTTLSSTQQPAQTQAGPMPIDDSKTSVVSDGGRQTRRRRGDHLVAGSGWAARTVRRRESACRARPHRVAGRPGRRSAQAAGRPSPGFISPGSAGDQVRRQPGGTQRGGVRVAAAPTRNAVVEQQRRSWTRSPAPPPRTGRYTIRIDGSAAAQSRLAVNTARALSSRQTRSSRRPGVVDKVIQRPVRRRHPHDVQDASRDQQAITGWAVEGEQAQVGVSIRIPASLLGSILAVDPGQARPRPCGDGRTSRCSRFFAVAGAGGEHVAGRRGLPVEALGRRCLDQGFRQAGQRSTPSSSTSSQSGLGFQFKDDAEVGAAGFVGLLQRRRCASMADAIRAEETGKVDRPSRAASNKRQARVRRISRLFLDDGAAMGRAVALPRQGEPLQTRQTR